MLEEGMFPDDRKKSNVFPIHKRDSKNLIKNYRPISLLPIFSKVFERLIFNSLFKYFIQNNLFTEFHVLLNFCQLRMKSTKVLIVIRHTI